MTQRRTSVPGSPEHLPGVGLSVPESNLATPAESKTLRNIRKRSVMIEKMRRERQREKIQAENMALRQRDRAHPWKRRFYCSDLCRMKTQLFLNDPDSGFGAQAYSWFLVTTVLLSYMMAIAETVRDTAAVGFPYNRKNLRPQRYMIAQLFFVTVFILDTVIRLTVAENWFCLGTVQEERKERTQRARRRHSLAQFHSDAISRTAGDGRPSFSPSQRPSRTDGDTAAITADVEPPFFCSVWNWIDIMSIVLVFLVGFSASFFIVLRVFRPIRNIAQFRIIKGTLMSSLRLLSVTTFFLISLIIFFAMVTFSVESCYNVNCQFADAFSALYFVVITMTSVGYGDQIPSNIASRLVAVIAMVIGSFYLAMPLAIIGDKFDKAWANYEAEMAKKRTAAENKMLNELKESRITADGRKRRILVLSYQALDAMNSTAIHLRNLTANKRGAKRALFRGYQRLFSTCGDLVDNLLTIYPSYMTLPNFVPRKLAGSKNGKPLYFGTFQSIRAFNRVTAHDDEDGYGPIGVCDATIVDSAASAVGGADRRSPVEMAGAASKDKTDGDKARTQNRPSFTQAHMRRHSQTHKRPSLATTAEAAAARLVQKYNRALHEVTFFGMSQSSQKSKLSGRPAARENKESTALEINIGAGETPQTVDGIPLYGPYWESQFRDLESPGTLTRGQVKRDLQLLDQVKRDGHMGRWVQCQSWTSHLCVETTRCLCASKRVNVADVMLDAKYKEQAPTSGTSAKGTNKSSDDVAAESLRRATHRKRRMQAWRSKLWLLFEAPDSSRAAFVMRLVRLFFTSAALLLVFVESMPELNEYGPDSRMCRSVVNWYCNWISTCIEKPGTFGLESACSNAWSDLVYSQVDVDALNPGCFPNQTLGTCALNPSTHPR